MKYLLTYLFSLFFFYVAVSQSPEKVEKILTITKDMGIVNELAEIVGKTNPAFEYVPNLNPLNPKKQKRISSKFGLRFHPIKKMTKQHLGIDLSAPNGTPVHCSASGTVIEARLSNRGYGNRVKIRHKFGFVTMYAHLSVVVVRKGAKVKKGDIVGAVGSTGLSTGNHLHYEIIKNKLHINPESIIIIHQE